MNSTLIQTKLQIPQLNPALVKRPFLIDKLEQGLAQKLTLVSAPVGFGKTTLVVNWLAEKTNACWLSLNENDNDPVQFWSYMIAALQTAVSHLGDIVLPALQDSPLTAVTTLINQLASRPATEKIILVLDDYHLIQTNEIHESVAFLLTHQPAVLHLVITTRADPPLPLMQLRVRRQMVEIRDSELRFNGQETAVFLNTIMQLDLSETDVAALENRTEGWVASLQLAALALQAGNRQAEEKHHLIATFAGSNRYLVDYLLEEVLYRQPPPIRHFLLLTAVFDRFCADLCNTIFANFILKKEAPPRPAKETLRYLETSNLFLILLDQERCWYRYHHLFAELLRYRLHETYPQEIKNLHRLASHWFAKNGLMEEAISHALAAEAHDEAITLIAQVAHAFFAAGKMGVLQKWLSQLPSGLVFSKQKLFLLTGWLLLRTGQFDEAEVLLQTPLPDDEPLTNDVEAELAYLLGYLAHSNGACTDAILFCERAKELVSPQKVDLIMPITSTLAMCAEMLGDMETAVIHHQAALKLGRKHNILTGTIVSLGMLARLHAQMGNLAEAKRLGADALQLAQEKNVLQLPLVGTIHIALGMVAQQEQAWETAVSHLRLGIDLTSQWGGLIFSTIKGYEHLLLILWQQNKTEQVDALLAELQQLQTESNLPAWAVARIDKFMQPSITSSTLPDPLTEREVEILGLMGNGRSAPKIASQLVIGVSTVRTHIKRIYSKLNVHSRHEAIQSARKYKLIK